MTLAWPLGQSPVANGAPNTPAPLDAPGTYPVPAGRGRWRLTLAQRDYTGGTPFSQRIVADLLDARSRRLEQSLNSSATLTFTLDGHSTSAKLLTELAHEVIAWRWDDQAGQDVAVFAGPICQTQDQLTEQSYTLNVTCHDYLALLSRRLLTSTLTINQQDQDAIVGQLLTGNWTASSGASLFPAANLRIVSANVDPSGAGRPQSGQIRDRVYQAQSTVLELLENLAAVVGGFDFDMQPVQSTLGPRLRLFYPYQGILRATPELIYGSTVATVDRTVNSADYANYWRVLGQADMDAPQVYAEAWDTNAVQAQLGSVGLWASGDSESDVTDVNTLIQKAGGSGFVASPSGGLLGQSSLLVPTYTLGLRPGAYSWGSPNMGDVVPFICQAGRLNVNTTIRVVGITYDIGDDGQEDVSLSVGRPDVTFGDIFRGRDRDIDALARR